ncbi:MAG: J domain-containing protein [Rhodospirillaceae bacterium]|nr:J domain-containing protein [Rhodospirillales bacterium]
MDSTADTGASAVKHSYTIPCASVFRDAVEALAGRRRVNVGDIARSVLLVMPAALIDGVPDPGDPPNDDRETIILKSGPAQGRPWRRKPRLQVRMAPGYDVTFIRRALALALAMDRGDFVLRLEDPNAKPPAPPPPPEPPPPEPPPPEPIADVTEEVERLKAIINVLAFEPLPHGISTRDDALHVLGFAPGARPDKRTIRARFRMLATIHHPDSNHGSHNRMSQLNQAMEFLKE